MENINIKKDNKKQLIQVISENPELDIIPILSTNTKNTVRREFNRQIIHGHISEVAVREYMEYEMYDKTELIFKDSCEVLIDYLLEHMRIPVAQSKNGKTLFGDIDDVHDHGTYHQYWEVAESQALSMEWKKAIFITVEAGGRKKTEL